jgi:SAM-dependent methyltransferase
MDQIFRYNEYNRNQFVASIARAQVAGSKVLDAGAGPCQYKPLFSHCDYKAQDFAKYPGKEHVYGELDYVSDIVSIPVEDNSFDLVICTEVLEHVPRPDLALKEFARILNPGGKLAITAPLGSAIHMPPYHYYGGFSPYWYEYFCELNGMSVESCVANGGFFKLYGQESRRFVYMVRPKDGVRRLLFLPVELLLRGFFSILIPIVCHVLDSLDKEQLFTAGYFVVIQKGNK